MYICLRRTNMNENTNFTSIFYYFTTILILSVNTKTAFLPSRDGYHSLLPGLLVRTRFVELFRGIHNTINIRRPRRA